jgi:hypothetical protein
MTLQNKYNKMAERIVVTPEMSERILKNISQYDFAKDNTKPKKTMPFIKVLSVAACFLVLIGGAVFLRDMIKPPVQVVPDIVEYENLAELSANIDFALTVPTEQLQDMKEISFVCIFKAIAEITYTDGNNTIRYRMAKGDGDISGDYTEYKDVKEYQGDKRTITLKGDETGFHLAIWTNEEFSFALSSERPLSESQILKIALSVR